MDKEINSYNVRTKVFKSLDLCLQNRSDVLEYLNYDRLVDYV